MKRTTISLLTLLTALGGCNSPIKKEHNITQDDLRRRLSPNYIQPKINTLIKDNYSCPYHFLDIYCLKLIQEEQSKNMGKTILLTANELYFKKLKPKDVLYTSYMKVKEWGEAIDEVLYFRDWKISPTIKDSTIGIKISKSF